MGQLEPLTFLETQRQMLMTAIMKMKKKIVSGMRSEDLKVFWIRSLDRSYLIIHQSNTRS